MSGAASKVLADYTQDSGTSDTMHVPRRRATVDDVMNGRRYPHELREDLHALYRLGFRDGCNQMEVRVDEAQHDANRFYYYLHNPEELRAQHAANLKAIDVRLARVAEKERWAELDRIAAERAEAAR